MTYKGRLFGKFMKNIKMFLCFLFQLQIEDNSNGCNELSDSNHTDESVTEDQDNTPKIKDVSVVLEKSLMEVYITVIFNKYLSIYMSLALL